MTDESPPEGVDVDMEEIQKSRLHEQRLMFEILTKMHLQEHGAEQTVQTLGGILCGLINRVPETSKSGVDMRVNVVSAADDAITSSWRLTATPVEDESAGKKH